MKNLIILILLLFFGFSQSKAIVQVPYSGIPHLDTAIYYHNIGVKEKTNHNDGPQVEKFLRYVGLGKGPAWCAAFLSYCIGVCKDVTTHIKTSMAQGFINKTSIKIKDVIYGRKPVPSGSSINFKKGTTRYGHVGCVYVWNKNHGQTVEGNAGDKVSFLNRTYNPRDYSRMHSFTPIKYKTEVQKKIDKIKLAWQPKTDNGTTNMANTY